MTELIQVIMAMIGALGFGALFHVRGYKLIVVALGGGLGWAVFLLMSLAVDSEALGYFVSALVISLFAEAMARLMKAPATVFIGPSLIPLVPGASLYRTMAYGFDGDMTKFVSQAIDTCKLAAALAIGVIASTVLLQFVLKFVRIMKIKRRKSDEK